MQIISLYEFNKLIKENFNQLTDLRTFLLTVQIEKVLHVITIKDLSLIPKVKNSIIVYRLSPFSNHEDEYFYIIIFENLKEIMRKIKLRNFL